MKICNFCGKNQNEVYQLVAGENDACICDACIQRCNDILMDNLRNKVDEVEKLKSFMKNNNIKSEESDTK